MHLCSLCVVVTVVDGGSRTANGIVIISRFDIDFFGIEEAIVDSDTVTTKIAYNATPIIRISTKHFTIEHATGYGYAVIAATKLSKNTAMRAIAINCCVDDGAVNAVGDGI